MKTILKITVVCMLLLTSYIALAADSNPKLTTNANLKSITLELDTNGQATTLRLINANSEELYFENIIDVQEYKRKFDFSELKEGDYSIIVENSLRFTIHSLSVLNDSIVMVGTKEDKKPTFKVLDRKIAFNFLNLEQEDVLVSIFDSESRTVFSEKMNDLVIEKAFNFENAYANNYTVIIKTDQKSYSEHIVID